MIPLNIVPELCSMFMYIAIEFYGGAFYVTQMRFKTYMQDLQ